MKYCLILLGMKQKKNSREELPCGSVVKNDED